MEKKIRDKSESYVGYLEDQREGSKGVLVPVQKQETLNYWAQIEKQLIKMKRSHDIQFKVLPKSEGEKRYKDQFPKQVKPKAEDKK